MTSGLVHKCGVFCKRPLVAFVLGTTLSYPFEHFLYEHVWPFALVTEWLHQLK